MGLAEDGQATKLVPRRDLVINGGEPTIRTPILQQLMEQEDSWTAIKSVLDKVQPDYLGMLIHRAKADSDSATDGSKLLSPNWLRKEGGDRFTESVMAVARGLEGLH